MCIEKQQKQQQKQTTMEKKRFEIAIYEVVKETEKAVCVKLMVSWNKNFHTRDIWMPKSVCEVFVAEYDNNRPHIMVDDWFVHKTESANSFNGYAMRFETILN